MKRINTTLHALMLASARLGTNTLQPPVSAQAPDESSTTASKSKLYTNNTEMKAGRYLVSFCCQHKSNNEAIHKYSHAVFLLDGEEIAFGDNATKLWNTFSNAYELDLSEGSHTFELKSSAEGGQGISIIRNAEITIILQNL